VNSKKLITFFFLTFFLIGSGCYAQDSDSSYVSSSASVASSPTQITRRWSDGWYQGASGYDRAVEEYKRTNQPMVVYMSVGWCPYCRRFEKEVLSSPSVQAMLKGKIKVNINPESGSRENTIASQYGIRGYPSFFLHPPQPDGAVQFYTGVTSEQFVEFFKQVLK